MIGVGTKPDLELAGRCLAAGAPAINETLGDVPHLGDVIVGRNDLSIRENETDELLRVPRKQ